MGRKKIALEEKRETLSVTIKKKSFDNFEKYNVKNRSKFIEWLLDNYFNNLKSNGHV